MARKQPPSPPASLYDAMKDLASRQDITKEVKEKLIGLANHLERKEYEYLSGAGDARDFLEIWTKSRHFYTDLTGQLTI